MKNFSIELCDGCTVTGAIKRNGYGHYKIFAEYNGQEFTCSTNDSLIYDNIDEEWDDKRTDAETGLRIILHREINENI